jgi:hypothetical protein
MATMTLPGGSSVSYETGGCTASARTTLFGSMGAYVASTYVPQVVGIRFEAYLANDGPSTSALRDWRSCMSSAGLTFADPGTAIASLQTDQRDRASLDRQQTAMAGADRACDDRTHLRARRSQALAQFVHTLPTQLLAQLADIHNDRTRAALVANQTLGR